MFEQKSQFFENIFPKYQCGFLKCFEYAAMSSGSVRKMEKFC